MIYPKVGVRSDQDLGQYPVFFFFVKFVFLACMVSRFGSLILGSTVGL